MVETTENGNRYNREYWPKCGTLIDTTFPNDLNDLWDKHAEQATVFVAEAIISHDTTTICRLNDDQIEIEVFLWTVGGDVITTTATLEDLIVEFSDTYSQLYGPAQEEDLNEHIAALERLEETISTAKDHMKSLIDEFRTKKAPA